jgi:bifunctional DNase/RNase
MIEMSIDSIRVSMMNYQRVIILKEQNAERFLPIWIGPAEADAIAIKLQGLTPPPPRTHDRLETIITALGATVNCVIVTDFQSDTFYAKLIIDRNGEQLELDSRPSDAIAVAIRAGAPIFADESVLDRVGILLDNETGKPMPQSQTKHHEPTEEELKSLSAFSDFIDTLDMDGLDQNKG